MNSFIEEFYCSSIDPQARSSGQNEKVQHEILTFSSICSIPLPYQTFLRGLSERRDINSNPALPLRQSRIFHRGGMGQKKPLTSILLQITAHNHQRKSQQILALPFANVSSARNYHTSEGQESLEM